MEIQKKFLHLKKQNFLILQETKLSYTSGNATFLYFWKGIFRTLANLELEAYSEP